VVELPSGTDGVFMEHGEQPRYFQNLDSLRFIAASLVMIHHAEQFKQLAGLPNCWTSPIIFAIGVQAVQFFFVLSGFLITYLLLKERSRTGTVDIKGFYRRRILRIWPLYYVTVALAFFLVPALHFGPGGIQYYQQELHAHFWENLFYFVVFLPNLQLAYYTPVLAGAQCWSLGVEEQFYMFWPALIKFFGRYPLRSLFAVFVTKALILRLCAKLHATHVLSYFCTTLSIEAMALGGIAAFVIIHTRRSEGSRPRMNALACTAACIIAALLLKYDAVQLVSLLGYAILIFACACMPRIGGRLQAPFEYLGKISYGLYMLHPVVMVVSLYVLHNLSSISDDNKSLLLYIIAFPLTIFVAACSNKFFESPFLRLKGRQIELLPSALQAVSRRRLGPWPGDGLTHEDSVIEGGMTDELLDADRSHQLSKH
jgi:peptidoglycan/LPS O-acetylase OafA/YrhL